MTIGPIETKYRDCLFRSRQEARWACCFDALDILWRYEAEGFQLDGYKYLPDFLLPELGIWLEIKGKEPTVAEFIKATMLAQYDRERTVLLTWENFEERTALDNLAFWHDDDGVFHSVRGWRWLTNAETGWMAARSARFEHGESGYQPRKAWPGLDWGETQHGELPY